MKAITKFMALAVLGGALLLTSCAGDYYVAAAPNEPYYVQPVAPYEGAVWIPGEWVWRGGSYVYVRGYYTRPRAGRTWVRGSWYHGQRGYAWHRGYWR